MSNVTGQYGSGLIRDITTDFRGAGPRTESAPFASLAITAVSADVTINGVAIPQGLTRVISGENIETDQLITGTDFFTTRIDS